MDRKLRVQNAIDKFLKHTLSYRWSSALAVLGVGGLARYGFDNRAQEILPYDTAVTTLVSFTLVVYQWDSLKDLLAIGSEEGKKPVSRRLFICLCCAILGCFYSVMLLPLNLYAEMLLGCSLIAFYFLPLKIVRRLLDRILIVRWVFLSTLIGGAGVLIGGSGEQISAKLPLLIPMICGNLVVCDYRDRSEDLQNPNRTGYSGDRKHVFRDLTLLFVISLMALFGISYIHDLAIKPWIFANVLSFGLLIVASGLDRWPWRLTLIADLALFAAAITLAVNQPSSV